MLNVDEIGHRPETTTNGRGNDQRTGPFHFRTGGTAAHRVPSVGRRGLASFSAARDRFASTYLTVWGARRVDGKPWERSEEHKMKTSRRVVRGPGGSTTSYTSSYSSSSSGFASGSGNHNGFASSRNGYVDGGISYGRSSSRDEDEAKLEDGLTYDEIRAQCLQQNRLFEDPEFPANNSSIFPSKRSPHPFEWKRPGVSDDHWSRCARKVIHTHWFSWIKYPSTRLEK